MTSNTRRFDGTCKCCGRDGLYVKKQKLCFACYVRLRRNGSTDYSDYFWRPGKEHNGWELVQKVDETHKLLKCINCGLERMVVNTTAYDLRKGRTKRRCGCYRKFAPRTERQAEAVKAYKDSRYNMAEAARTLCVTRQTMEEILRSCEVKADAE